MAIIFKYKNPMNVSYAPGFVKGGTDGRQGDQGVTGNALYFVDYELDNSYNIELALQKIEKGYLLNSSSIEKIEERRTYKVNDLLLTPTGKCYRLILSSNDSSFKNYKYDIEYLGSIKKKGSPAVLKVVFKDITNKTIGGKTYSSIQYSPFPTNRSTTDGSDVLYEMGTSGSVRVPQAKPYYPSTAQIYQMRGRWYEVYLVGTNSSIDQYYRTDRGKITDATEAALVDKLINEIDTAAITPCRYSLQLHLKNQKKYCLEFAPDDESTYNATSSFYKILEFNDLNMHVDPSARDNMAEDQRIADDAISDNMHKYHTYVYISDYMLDRYHLFGNNLQCTVNADKTMWYKTGLYSEDGIFTPADASLGPSVVKTFIDGVEEEYYNVTNIDTNEEEQEETPPQIEKHYVCSNTVDFYEQGNVFHETTRARTTEQGAVINSSLPTVEGFPKYAMPIERESRTDMCGNSLLFNNDIVMKYEITKHAADNSSLVNIFKKDNTANPLRSGDSAYFSSITDNAACIAEIDKFLSNQENIAIVTSKNLSTGEALMTEVPIEIIK